MNQLTLPNGLRIIHETSTSEVVYCGYAVDAGTRDERSDEQGMAHFVEHILFKGTQKRRAWHILNRLENVGGDLNAYTNKEETVIHAAVLSVHFARAVELLSDIVFHSVFPQHEIQKEVEVVIDEIQSYEDTPSELIFDNFESLLFDGHALGHNILGSPDLLKQFDTERIRTFTERYYHPSNMVFFVKGNLPFSRIVQLLQKHTADIPAGCTREQRSAPPLYQPQRLTIPKSTHQAHVILGRCSYPATDDRRTALYLLNNMLGGPGMNSRLNLALRERRGLVYTIESNLISYTDTGVFSIYFGTDPADVERCMQLVDKELKRLRDTALTHSQLHAAKKQLIGQIGVSADQFENRTLGMAKSFLHYHKYETPKEVFARIDSLTSAGLLEVANEMLNELSVLIYRKEDE